MEREEEDPSNPNQTSNRILEQSSAAAAANRKHAAMLERLSNRKQQSLSRKFDSSSLDSTQSFLSQFSQSKLSIESDISLCRQSTDETESTLKSGIEQISISIANLEKLVAENSYSLPSFEVRTCLEAISDLKQTLDTVASDVVPKKRFAFKKKKAPSTGVENRTDSKTPETQSEQRSFVVRHSPGFKDKENEILVKEFKGSEMGEFSISDLNSCEVRLKGCLKALFVHNLRNCKVYVGPVFGSVLIEKVEGCVFVLTSHQIRIHDARGSDFYLRVRSRPIIEDCSGVRFAPYCLGYEGIQRDLKESNLDEETGNWANVDDFLWLKAVQSPNWSILPESERIGRVTIMNSEK